MATADRPGGGHRVVALCAAAVGGGRRIEWRPKHWVALAGCSVYGANTVGVVLRENWSLWVNIIGPIVGVTTVTTGWALSAAGIINVSIRPDIPQVVGGVLQTWAWIESFRLLSLQRQRNRPTLLILPTGVALQWTF